MIDFDLFIKEMQRLIIKQYFGKPRAMGEIELYCKMIKDVVDLINQLENVNGFPIQTLSLLSGFARPPAFTDKDFFAMLKAIFGSKNLDPTIVGLQKIYSNIFDKKAIVTDNKNGTFSILIDTSVSQPLTYYFQNHNNRLPSPVGILPILKQQQLTDFFGFKDNINAIGFGDKRPNTAKGGHFVEKI